MVGLSYGSIGIGRVVRMGNSSGWAGDPRFALPYRITRDRRGPFGPKRSFRPFSAYLAGLPGGRVSPRYGLIPGASKGGSKQPPFVTRAIKWVAAAVNQVWSKRGRALYARRRRQEARGASEGQGRGCKQRRAAASLVWAMTHDIDTVKSPIGFTISCGRAEARSMFA